MNWLIRNWPVEIAQHAFTSSNHTHEIASWRSTTTANCTDWFTMWTRWWWNVVVTIAQVRCVILCNLIDTLLLVQCWRTIIGEGVSERSLGSIFRSREVGTPFSCSYYYALYHWSMQTRSSSSFNLWASRVQMHLLFVVRIYGIFAIVGFCTLEYLYLLLKKWHTKHRLRDS